MPYSGTPDRGVHLLIRLIHPINVFFELWTMTIHRPEDRQMRSDVLFTKALLLYLLLILVAMIYLSAPYGRAS